VILLAAEEGARSQIADDMSLSSASGPEIRRRADWLRETRVPNSHERKLFFRHRKRGKKTVELQRSGSSKETEKDTQRERPDFYPSTKSTMFPLPSRRAKQEANQLKIYMTF